MEEAPRAAPAGRVAPGLGSVLPEVLEDCYAGWAVRRDVLEVMEVLEAEHALEGA